MKPAIILRLLEAVFAAALFAAPAAQAASIQCNIINTSGPEGTNIWPYSARVKACTGTSSLIILQNGLWAVVHEYDSVVNGKEVGKGPVLQQQYQPQVYLFHNVTDYATFMKGTNCPAIGNDGFGVTFFNARCSVTGDQPYTVVFEYSIFNQINFVC